MKSSGSRTSAGKAPVESGVATNRRHGGERVPVTSKARSSHIPRLIQKALKLAILDIKNEDGKKCSKECF